MNEIENFISSKKYNDALQECLRTNHNYLGLILSHVLDSNSFIKQFQSNIKGIKKEGESVSEKQDTSQDINPSLLEDNSDTQNMET